MKKSYLNQLTGQIGENLVVAELGRRGILGTTFTGNLPDIDVLAYKDGKSIPVQVKTKNKGKSKDVNRRIIFVIVFIGEKLGDEEFFIGTKGDIQDII